MGLKSLLRYNTRHYLYFPGDGKLPKFNPICSRSHAENSGKRTRSYWEPLWSFRLRQRWFAFAGRQRCGRRDDVFGVNYEDGHLPDTWDLGPDGNRTCSYCGSIHPDDLMDICRKTLTDDQYAVEGTTKAYKVYVRQPGVQNASQGAIKFYMQHMPTHPSKEMMDLFDRALQLSQERFEAKYFRQAS